MRSSSSAEVASEHDERFEETPILSYQLSMRDIFPAPVDLAVIDIVLPETSNEATFATPSSSKYIIAGDASLPTIESTQLTQTPIESDTYHVVQLTAYYLDLEENAIHEEEDDEQVLHFQITMEDLVSAPSESVTEIILDAGTMTEAQSEIDFEDWQDLIWLGEAMCNMPRTSGGNRYGLGEDRFGNRRECRWLGLAHRAGPSLGLAFLQDGVWTSMTMKTMPTFFCFF
ncbi:uncharacterized protein PAC_11401 [Phialocephala subalpina]|uniref:Uncharacterized protein n=1 Tax=Phialocephala subalpina TaxID=576137 RepID=A0A1L7X910_9HELO|nr:uncharacterized protein PAC_11401 [Phialocephala subalpina]